MCFYSLCLVTVLHLKSCYQKVSSGTSKFIFLTELFIAKSVVWGAFFLFPVFDCLVHASLVMVLLYGQYFASSTSENAVNTG